MADRRTRVDEAIDRAVRDMVQHDAQPGFRRRVMARLAAPARRVWWGPGVALAAAAAAILLTVVLMRPSESVRPAAPASQQSENVPAPQAAPPVRESTPVGVPPAAPVESGRRAQRQPAAGKPAAPVISDPRRLESIFGPRNNRVAATSLPGDVAPRAPLVLPELRFVRVTLDSVPAPPIPVIR